MSPAFFAQFVILGAFLLGLYVGYKRGRRRGQSAALVQGRQEGYDLGCEGSAREMKRLLGADRFQALTEELQRIAHRQSALGFIESLDRLQR